MRRPWTFAGGPSEKFVFREAASSKLFEENIRDRRSWFSFALSSTSFSASCAAWDKFKLNWVWDIFLAISLGYKFICP